MPEMKDRHNTVVYFSKIISVKACSNNYIFGKFGMISTFCIEMASNFSTTPSEPFCPRGKK